MLVYQRVPRVGEFLIAANSPKHGRTSVVPPLTEPLEGENAWPSGDFSKGLVGTWVETMVNIPSGNLLHSY